MIGFLPLVFAFPLSVFERVGENSRTKESESRKEEIKKRK
jgi:hypothetical protein